MVQATMPGYVAVVEPAGTVTVAGTAAALELLLDSASVVPRSPCDRERSHVAPGEVLLAIDGVPVGPDVDVDLLLTLEEVRDLDLTVADAAGAERTVTVRPEASLYTLLYEEWVERTGHEAPGVWH